MKAGAKFLILGLLAVLPVTLVLPIYSESDHELPGAPSGPQGTEKCTPSPQGCAPIPGATCSSSAAPTCSPSSSPECSPPIEPTFDICLPKLDLPCDEEGEGWVRPPVWGNTTGVTDDTITIPKGRPIYALIVSGYSQNRYLDQLLVYRFARHLMAHGAYVHYAWWNNLLAPYMERPLHHNQSYPGDLSNDFLNFTTAAQAAGKALPGEDYQFVADAKLFLSAIRENNPSAMIIVVGHSMGGSAIVHLGWQTSVLIDILAPIDPVNNRNYPWAGLRSQQSDFNWTRWRVTRHNFRGYKSVHFRSGECQEYGPWLENFGDAHVGLGCSVFVHPAPRESFRCNIINLHFRYQREAIFPFDFPDTYHFDHDIPPGGVGTETSEIPMTPDGVGEVGGWPQGGDRDKECCEDFGSGVGWAKDGHGEIVGHRGPARPPGPIPLGVRVRTSPQCGDKCPSRIWPDRSQDGNGTWHNGNSCSRVLKLKCLEMLGENDSWENAPVNPSLCLVSQGLINRFEAMNKPPVANAGPEQTIECTGPGEVQVTLDGTGSSDPDNDALEYTWTWSGGSVSGAVVTVSLSLGTYDFTLTVRDPSGHIAVDMTRVIIQDTTPPDLTVMLTPTMLWPPNHRLRTINATVDAHDLCGQVANLQLLSIVSNQPDDGTGDGDTAHDIQDADFGTLDLVFQLRAERAAPLGDRHYTVTYHATDDSGNSRDVSTNVIVPLHP